MAGDWIKLHRKTMESAVFANDSLFRLWCYCLMAANYKDGWFCPDRKTSPVKVKRGSFITGRFALHAALYPKQRKSDPSPSTVWRWLETLRDLGNLHIETNSQFSIVTVCKYGTYQSDARENEQQFEQAVNSDCTASEQRVNSDCTQYKKDKKVKNTQDGAGESDAVDFSRVLFPSDFDTPEVRELCEQWINHCSAKNKPTLDPSSTLTNSMRLFRTRGAFIHNIRHAMANGYVTIKNYEEPPANDKPAATRKTFV